MILRIKLRAYELRPLDWKQRRFIVGNFRTFGFWSGLRGNLTLMSPLLNTILNWKYRNMGLSISVGGVPVSLDKAMDSDKP